MTDTTQEKMIIGFWKWFVKHETSKSGWKRLVNKWILLHLIVGIILATLLPKTIEEVASVVLLPLSGILVGLSFAWVGNAVALLQSDEIQDISEKHPGGFEDYVYVFQLAVLTILFTVVFWGIAGMGIFDKVWPTIKSEPLYYIVTIILFSVSSLAVQECWNVVMGAQQMLLAQQKLREIKNHKKLHAGN